MPPLPNRERAAFLLPYPQIFMSFALSNLKQYQVNVKDEILAGLTTALAFSGSPQPATNGLFGLKLPGLYYVGRTFAGRMTYSLSLIFKLTPP